MREARRDGETGPPLCLGSDGRFPTMVAIGLRRGRRSDRVVEAAAHYVHYNAQYEYDRPNQHYCLDVELGRIHPTPYECVEKTDEPQNSFEDSLVLEEFDQHNNKADQPDETQ